MMRSRVALAVMGIVLLGGAGALVGALSAPQPPTTSLALAPSDAPTATTAQTGTGAPTGATVEATATATDALVGSGTPGPTDTSAVPTPTNTPLLPTATPTTFTNTGAISNVNTTAQTFMLTIPGGTYTVHWLQSTHCSGLTTNCARLPSYATNTYQATAVGTPHAGHYVVASTINVQLADT
jgi:hypothetical protein